MIFPGFCSACGGACRRSETGNWWHVRDVCGRGGVFLFDVLSPFVDVADWEERLRADACSASVLSMGARQRAADYGLRRPRVVTEEGFGLRNTSWVPTNPIYARLCQEMQVDPLLRRMMRSARDALQENQQQQHNNTTTT